MPALSGVSYQIHLDLDEPADPSTGKIFLWLSYNGGKLNNYISTFYDFVSGDYVPQLGDDEANILKSLYFAKYYTDKARGALMGSEDNNILSLRDDISSVSFINRKEIGKEYKSIAKDYLDEVYDLANLYKHNRSGPRTVETTHTGHWE